MLFYFIIGIISIGLISPAKNHAIDEKTAAIAPLVVGTTIGCSISYTLHSLLKNQTALQLSHHDIVLLTSLASIISICASIQLCAQLFKHQTPQYKLNKALEIIARIETEILITANTKTTTELFFLLQKRFPQKNFLVTAESFLTDCAQDIFAAYNLLHEVYTETGNYAIDDHEYAELARVSHNLEPRVYSLARRIEFLKNMVTNNESYAQQQNLFHLNNVRSLYY